MTGVELAQAGDGDRLLLAVLERGESLDVEVLERIVALKEREEDRQATRALHDAIATFQGEVGPIPKTKRVDFAGRSGHRVTYSYAPLDVIAEAIREPLARAGLSYTWDSKTEPAALHCICTVRHVHGAKVTASFGAPIDTEAKMSGPQRAAAALTYARRQSLVQALGLTSADTDTDAEDGLTGEHISSAQVKELHAWVKNSGADLDRFLDLLGVATFSDLDTSRFEEAKDLLRRKMEAKE